MRVDPKDLDVGDRGSVSVALTVDGTVSHRFIRGPKGEECVAVITTARDERVFPIAEITSAIVVSRGNDVPAKIPPRRRS